jgi:acyl transferase domain-containing protein/NADPH:quinone reductase-like Zn-dependent oxidoreductase/acyl carrier protein
MNDQIRERREPIAIVGIGCRFPGGANPPDLWRLLMNGGNAIGPVPRERVDLEALYDPRPATPGRSMTKWGGVIPGLEAFDAAFFNLSPREAELVDPSQRLLLETAWEALEDAGIPAEAVKGTDGGVFVGLWLNEYESRLTLDLPTVDFYATLGTGRYSASGRLSYFLDLRGPSVTLDTACSSSLVAIHLACRSLWSGECSFALAGGANTILEPFVTVAFSQVRMMAPDGKCKFGDAGADGFVRSDGAGLIALERLDDAEAAGHHVYAVILGSAVNSDGRGSGFLARPAQDGHEDLLRKAYGDARVSPGLVQYVEAHGAGTRAGDPVEIGALGAVLAEGRAAGRRCRIGSIKTNIGHTEAAAGVAGIVKVALALKHGIIPKSLHLVERNPRIPWADLPLDVQTETTGWPAGVDGAIAGVSSFGVSGTNAHVVLQACPNRQPSATGGVPSNDRVRLLPLSAQTPEALSALARSWAVVLRQCRNESSFRDLCYTATVGRSQLEHCLAVVARTADEAAEHLEAFVAGETRPALVNGRRSARDHKVVFIFPGQGSQWLGMGRGLLRHEPAFASVLEQCDAAVRAQTGWSVLDELHADQVHSRLAHIDVVQPVLFSVQVAMAALWRSWGVEPAAVVGHSMGEVAAAYVAGALSLEHAAQIVCRRSALLRRTSGKGAMAVVDLSFDEARAVLRGHDDRLSVAVSNSPRSTVISGDPRALDTLISALETREVFCRRVKVDVASHSPQMDPLRADLFAALEGVEAHRASIAFHSTVEARRLDGRELEASYWVRNLREPVLFAPAVQQLITTGYDTFIEMSAHPLLLGAVQEMLLDANAEGSAIASGRRDEDEPSVIFSSLAALRVAGFALPWHRLVESDSALVGAPFYPWQREHFWRKRPAALSGRRSSAADLLGMAFRPAQQDHQTYWEFGLSVGSVPSLKDHRIRGSIVVPAAFFLETVRDAAARVLQGSHIAIESVAFTSPLVLSEDTEQTVQIVFSSAGPGSASFCILSRRANEEVTERWVEHVRGRVRATPEADRPAVSSPESYRAECERAFDGEAHYAAMSVRGLHYGPNYRRLQDVFRGARVLIARVSQPEPPSGIDGDLQARATVLDGCFQALVAAIPSTESDGGDTYVPTALASLRLYGRPEAGADIWCQVAFDDRRSTADADTIAGDVVATDVAGNVVMEARGLQLFRLERELDAKVRSAFYRLDWVEASRMPRESTDAGVWIVVGTSNVSRDLAARLQARGARVTHAAASANIGTAFNCVVRGVVDTSSIGVGDPTDTANLAASLALTQGLVASERTPIPRLWFVTTGAQAVAVEPLTSVAGAALWGFRSVVAAEHPRLRCSAIDVGDAPGPSVLEALVGELLDDGAEDQIVLRGQRRHVRRLHQGVADNSTLPLSAAAGRSYRATTTVPGILDGLTLEDLPRRAPGPHEVEIEVAVTALNFMNVMSALGVYPGYPNGVGPLGIECAGRVVRVGDHVSRFGAGDLVMAFAFDSLATHALAHERMVAPVPDGLTLHEAATIPVAFLTAYYALHYLARIRPGESVLIHSAASGVGLAALQFAEATGAVVFATAGTEERREALRKRGVAYVGDSHALGFADEIRAMTNGEGVDIVINSLSGEAIPEGVSLLRTGGRFVELSKRDIAANRPLGLGVFKQNVAYLAVDLDAMGRKHPELVGEILSDCLQVFRSSRLEPLAAEVFHVSNLPDAFRRMAQGRHSGKILIAIDPINARIRSRGSALPSAWSEGAYLITGGMGALGLEVARWMIERGARDLVLMSRRGEGAQPDPRVHALRMRGARVVVARGDVSNRADVSAVLDDIAASGRALKGVVHAAGLLDDATLDELTADHLTRSFAPKINGAMHLHELTVGLPLDFFVMFSSVAAFVGSAGQANYAAANACLDALARHRRANGLPAISINWGPWSEIGLAAASAARGARLDDRGLGSLMPDFGLALLGEILKVNPVHVAAMRFDVHRWCEAHAATANMTLFEDLRDGTAKPTAHVEAVSIGIREELEQAPPGRRRRELLEAHLQEQAAHVLKLMPSRIDPTKPLQTMGLDSLMGLELRNRLEAGTGITVPATLIWKYPTVRLLAPQIAVRMGIGLDEAPPSRDDVTRAAEAGSFAGDQIVTAGPYTSPDDAVAVIGIACRFPGGGTSPEAFWTFLERGESAVGPPPAARWQWPDGVDLATTHRGIDRGAFLASIDEFDAEFFRASPSEATRMDPQQRLLLELSWEALEDAGHRPGEARGRNVGVFVGACQSDYAEVLSTSSDSAARAAAGAGNAYMALATRLSHFYDFTGPRMTLDTACASALFALYHATSALARGECQQALVGAVNLLCTATTSVSYHGTGLLSRSGLCRSFDERADGCVRGEGAGMLLLKPLAAALRDGDAVYGLIKATTVNQGGGQTAAVNAVTSESQADVIEAAWRAAGTRPDSAGYIESHGLGTRRGDAVEVAGIVEAFRRLYRARGRELATAASCGLGAVKTNIGHLEAAAGLAGVIKVLLAIGHGRIPRTLHFEHLNPDIDLGNGLFHVVAQNEDWPERRDEHGHLLPRRAGVSAFGYGGANAHVVIEEHAPPTSHADVADHEYLVPLSAQSRGQLVDQARRLLAYLERTAAGGESATSLRDIAYTLQVGRDVFPERVAFVVSGHDDLISTLRRYVAMGQHVPAQVAGESDGHLRRTGQLWMSGVDVDWTQLYRGVQPRRAHLPTYPFRRARCWPSAPTQQTPSDHHEDRPVHSAVDEPSVTVGGEIGVLNVLRDAWRCALGVADIGLDQRPITELGAESVHIMRVLASVTRELCVAISPQVLLAGQTIRRQGELIGRALRTHIDAGPLIRLNAGEPRRVPFVLIHGADGHAFNYVRLVRRMEPSRPIYALVSPWLDPDVPFDPSAAVRTYRDCLARELGGAAFVLGGWSYGGVLAIQIAQQLEDANQRAAGLVLLDLVPTAPRQAQRFARCFPIVESILLDGDGSPYAPIAHRPWVANFARDHFGVHPVDRFIMGVRQRTDRVELTNLARFVFPTNGPCLPDDDSRALDVLCGELEAADPDRFHQFFLPGQDGRQLHRAALLFKTNVVDACTFAPSRRLSLPILAMCATATAGAERWDGATSERLTVRQYPIRPLRGKSVHASMMDAANVDLFADDLRDYLLLADQGAHVGAH